MTGVRRVLGYDLEQDWGEVYGKEDFAGELVLDIGADRGSTARFVLEHGARAVVCSEPPNSLYYRELRAFADQDDRVAVVRPVLDVERADVLLSSWRPDTVKLDCEGCEEFWPDALMRHRPPCILAETHGEGLGRRFMGVLGEDYDITLLSERESSHARFTVLRADLR